MCVALSYVHCVEFLSVELIPEFGVPFILEKQLQNDTIVALG